MVGRRPTHCFSLIALGLGSRPLSDILIPDQTSEEHNNNARIQKDLLDFQIKKKVKYY